MSLRDVFVQSPDSARIAADLERLGACLCSHKQNPCRLYCGVRCDIRDAGITERREGDVIHLDHHFKKLGPWQTYTLAERRAWLDRVDPEETSE